VHSPPKHTHNTTQTADKILSDIHNGTFLTKAINGELQKRDQKGHLLEEMDRPWLSYAERVTLTSSGGWALHLNKNEDKLWLAELDNDYLQSQTLTVSEKRYLWTTPKMLWDGNSVWVGYTTATNLTPYSPSISQFNSKGFKGNFTWKDKGVFFDFCLDYDGSVLLSRDIPSPQFTVPVYPFLERIASDMSTQTYYSGETNWFIDSLVCGRDSIYMIERSIFGSDGSRIVFKKRDATAIELFKLPAQAMELYACQ